MCVVHVRRKLPALQTLEAWVSGTDPGLASVLLLSTPVCYLGRIVQQPRPGRKLVTYSFRTPT